MSLTDDILATLRAGRAPAQELSDAVMRLPDAARAALIETLLADAAGRRWLRAEILGRLDPDAAATLARRLLTYREDFARDHRDRTTPPVVRHLPPDTLAREAPFLADSNAAAALWERLSGEGTAAVVAAAERVLAGSSPAARETALYLLLLDPYDPLGLPGDARDTLLRLALNDPDAEIRGLAAEIAVDEDPELLLRDFTRWIRDPGERIRMAAWTAAFAKHAERATDDATLIVADEEAPLPARRAALIALGDYLPTPRVELLLSAMVVHPSEELAQDAANLLWSRHRTPVIAQAAAQSAHPGVRAIAERLLHPTVGSPAAGGFRPGAEEQGYGFYDEFFRRDEPRGGAPDRHDPDIR